MPRLKEVFLTKVITRALKITVCIAEPSDSMETMRALLMLVMASCTIGSSSTPTAPTPQQGPCPALEGHTFASVDMLECGLGPGGVGYCTWHLAFDADDRFEWQHSDVGESGRVTCAGASVTPDSENIIATYDDSAQTLTWDGEVYTLEP